MPIQLLHPGDTCMDRSVPYHCQPVDVGEGEVPWLTLFRRPDAVSGSNASNLIVLELQSRRLTMLGKTFRLLCDVDVHVKA
jgi:hypothetical protein